MNMNIDLLRPFNLEEAEKGAKLLCLVSHRNNDGDEECTLVASSDKEVVVNFPKFGFAVADNPEERFRMAPLFWLEGRPVYAGDRVYGKWYEADEEGHVVSRVDGDAVWFDTDIWSYTNRVTWDKPSPKKVWVNVYEADFLSGYHSAFVTHGFKTKALADEHRSSHNLRFIKCVCIDLTKDTP